MEASSLIVLAYGATMTLLGVWGLHRLALLVRFRWEGNGPETAPLDERPPRVTVQLPLFNERTVAERLIRHAGALDYPADRLEIQVLDDSTDDTREVVDRAVAALVARGIDARVVRRPSREGFKAGALDHGMALAKGELLCVFDADFLPPPDFLRRLVPHFQDPRVGMVQARWEHENRDESALTRAQATLLDGHFVIEHKVRHDAGLFFNFNGTAGIWRRETIEGAGGWQHDTLTEDLDLSYRAQLAGWRFRYLPFVVAPAELPPDIAAFKSQQKRWAKGSMQVLKKLGGTILASRQPWRVRLEALAHLTGNVGYPAVLTVALLLPLTLRHPRAYPQWLHLLAFALCTLSVLAFYERSERALRRPLRRRLVDMSMAVALGIGMSVSQTRAVVEGLFGNTGVFVRTPKRGSGRGGYRATIAGLPGVELLLAAWFAWGIAIAVRSGQWGALPFLGLFLAGFAWVGGLSLAVALRR